MKRPFARGEGAIRLKPSLPPAGGRRSTARRGYHCDPPEAFPPCGGGPTPGASLWYTRAFHLPWRGRARTSVIPVRREIFPRPCGGGSRASVIPVRCEIFPPLAGEGRRGGTRARRLGEVGGARRGGRHGNVGGDAGFLPHLERPAADTVGARAHRPLLCGARRSGEAAELLLDLGNRIEQVGRGLALDEVGRRGGAVGALGRVLELGAGAVDVGLLEQLPAASSMLRSAFSRPAAERPGPAPVSVPPSTA